MGTVVLWLGRAGSGKTHRIGAAIAAQLDQDPLGGPLYWLVPTDASYATERVLLQHAPVTVRAEVLGLERLAQRLRAAQRGGAQRAVNATGQRLLLATVFQEAASDLQVLHRATLSIPFLDAVLAGFAEMSACQVALPQLEAALETAATRLGDWPEAAAVTGHALLGKLRDLCILYVQWRRAVSAHGLLDPHELLEAASQAATDSPNLAQSTVFIDGFEDLTAQELHFVLSVAAASKETIMALSCDAQWLDGSVAETDNLVQMLDGATRSDAIYAPQTLALVQRIQAACTTLGIPVRIEQDDAPSSPRFGAQPWLTRLEQHLFGAGPEAAHWASPSSGTQPEPNGPDAVTPLPAIQVVAAQNRRAEVDFIAHEIRRLIRTGELSYADVAVVVPSLQDYGAALRESFERYEIAYDSDAFPSFATHPLAKFTLALLHTVADDLALAACARLLKTEFSGLSREDADWLETYLGQYGIEGAPAWFQSDNWKFAETVASSRRSAGAQVEDERADGLRRRIARWLEPWYRALEPVTCRPIDLAIALWSTLEAVDAKRLIARWATNEDATQTPLEASLHEQAWQRLIALIDDLSQTGAEYRLPRSFLFRLVERDIEDQALSTVPAHVDAVLVTEWTRARQWEADTVFFAGVSDGVVPARVHATGLLQDDERAQFQRLFGTRLAYSAQERQLCQRSTVYSALTRARRRLYLSYPLSNEEGKEMRPSLLIQRVQQLFAPPLPERLWTSTAGWDAVIIDTTAGGAVVTPDWSGWSEQVALEWLADSLRRQSPGTVQSAPTRRLLAWFEREGRQRHALDQTLHGWTHRTGAAALAPVLARGLYRPPVRVSVHRLETFAACPFRHFAQYGLRLTPPESTQVQAIERGNLVHDVLLAFVQHHMRDAAQWQQMSDETAMASMQRVFADHVEQNGTQPQRWAATRQQRTGEALRVLEHAAVVLTRHARHGQFHPQAVELAFGEDTPDSLPGVDVTLDDGTVISLRGRIDRIDSATDGETHAFRIVDYKSSSIDLDLTEVAHGLRMQLPVYAAVVERHAETLFGRVSRPAGMMYIPILYKVDIANQPTEEASAAEDVRKKMRARGLLVEDAQLIGWMDDRLPGGAASELFQKIYNQNGSLAKWAPTVPATAWQALTRHVMDLVKTFGTRLLDGDIAISPYKLGSGKDACQFCPYGSVCQIDPRWDDRPFRRLQKRDRQGWVGDWQAASEEVSGDGQ